MGFLWLYDRVCTEWVDWKTTGVSKKCDFVVANSLNNNNNSSNKYASIKQVHIIMKFTAIAWHFIIIFLQKLKRWQLACPK